MSPYAFDLRLIRAFERSSFLTSPLPLRVNFAIQVFDPNSPARRFDKLKSASRLGQRRPAPEGVTFTSAKLFGDAPANPCASSTGNMKVAPFRNSTTIRFVRRS